MNNKKVVGGLVLGILSVLILGFILVFVVFGNNTSDNNEPTNTTASQTEDTGTSEENSQETSENLETAEEQTQEDTDEEQSENIDKTSCYGTWVPSKVEDGLTGEEISFSEAFGNEFYQIENSLELSEDGSFQLVLGTMKSEDEGKGTFEISGESLSVTYASGKSDIFKLYIDGDGNILYVLVPRYNFTVYFERA